MNTITQHRPLLDGVDLMSQEYADHPDRTVERAQAEQPVYYYPPMNIWVLTRHDDVRAAFSDSETFSSQAWGLVPPPADLAPRVPDLFNDVQIASMDPPDHAKLRIPVQRGLSPGVVGKAEGMVRRIANELIDGFVEDGECDLMREFSYKLPLYAVLELLGLPKDHADHYHEWGLSLFALFTPKALSEGSAPEHLRPIAESALRKCWENLAEANEYLRGVVEQIDREPNDSMLSQLLQLREADGSRKFSVGENVRNALGFVSAGHDTSAALIGNLIYYTHRDPAVKQRLAENPSSIPAAVEETLRRRGSADGMFRITTRDVEVCGVTIPKGSIVFLHITAANLDPAEFSDPLSFDIDRPNLRRMLSFGGGRHVCAGQHLGRMEAQVAYEELTRRLPNLRLKPGFEISYEPTLMNVIIRSLPVMWDAP